MATSAAALKEEPATTFAKDQLKAIVERIERLEEEKKTISDDIRDVYAEAKGNGYDVKALRAVVRLRKQDANFENGLAKIDGCPGHLARRRAEPVIGRAFARPVGAFARQ